MRNNNHTDSDESDEDNARTARRGNTRGSNNNDGEKKVGCMDTISLCCFKFQERTKISVLEMKIKQRQKKFGVDYLTMVENSASPQELKGCLKDALNEVGEHQTEMNEHFDNIQEKEEETKEKAENPPAVVTTNNSNQRGKRNSSSNKNPTEEEEEEGTFENDQNNTKGKKKKPGKVVKPGKSKFSIDDE